MFDTVDRAQLRGVASAVDDLLTVTTTLDTAALDAATPAQLLTALLGVVRSCALVGRSRATHHRQANPKPRQYGPHPKARHPAELTAAERNADIDFLSPTLVTNRLIWMAIGLAALALAFALFRFSDAGAKRKRRRGDDAAPPAAAARATAEPLPSPFSYPPARSP